MDLSKRRRISDDEQYRGQVESLLKKAVELDPKLSVGYLQLGILYSEQQNFPQAMVAFKSAIAADSDLEEAHYRLAQLYRRVGQKTESQEELERYQQLSRKAEEQTERQRHEIQQFVYTLRDPSSASQAPE